MACEFICDGCGERAPGEFYLHGDHNWHKPTTWFERSDDDGVQTVCSRACIKKVADKTGKTSVILPF
jgi:sarcosine oxidase delta subunit